ncbi:hypothetical protein GPY51_22290 [Photorhabdus laumondii subsp. laumondii]|uniref:Photorhabdus luminescens subsp. laumondii TTO1 complete genome segment 11/17 n=2 Tax=Photorhabdus laumondii subsp. laumondii TaxID=141679 RepID=Q7N2H7_PHOLL|nr:MULTISPECIES: hypothetical protein [Photorhabdus]AXG48118.1 hypothetical protein PluTT01m_15960 [Photorhabdus laumondii subsp. laumondii]MCC8415667.1 hypothetical protein [Photorhabdus laumondii]NDK97048.1 hypothetical protein [Photorhabdus laumondii subsp. laumondii]NDL23248.1 hypothetical protein [Photorhabdus laumondii subsp. laumondii]NDL32226.1 hypothetical protein [Photorhabdus laumondii subsp. laumondii]
MSFNKKAFLIATLLVVSHFSMACNTDPMVEHIIKSYGLQETKVMSMYKNCELDVVNTGNRIILTNNKSKNRNERAEIAMYWYRGMGIEEFKLFDSNKFKSIPCVNVPNRFCGISPEYTYAKSYPMREDKKFVIEFSTVEPGWLYNEFTTKHNCEIDVESRGESYGLGGIGALKKDKSNCQPKGYKVGDEFNKWLSEKPVKIEAIIAYIQLPISD